MIKKREWLRRACGIILLWGLGGECLPAAPLRLVGSDLLGPGVASAVKGFAEEKGIEIEVDFQGSLRGRRDLEAGRAEVALISFSPGDEDLPVEYSEEPLAYHVVFLWVPRELSLPQLSYGQVAEILSNDTAGSRKRWRDFGAQGEGSSRLALPGEVEGTPRLTSTLLQHKLGLSDSYQLERDEDAQDKHGGILVSAHLPLADDEWEAVPISLKPSGRAYQSTPINVHRGDYPLSWPLRLVFRRADVESLYPLLRFLLSEEVARELHEARMVPLPETVRHERIFDLERL